MIRGLCRKVKKLIIALYMSQVHQVEGRVFVHVNGQRGDVVARACVKVKDTYKYLIYLRLDDDVVIKLITAQFFKADYSEIILHKASAKDIFQVSSVDILSVNAVQPPAEIGVALKIIRSVRYGGAAQQRRIILGLEPFSVNGVHLRHRSIKISSAA